MKKKKKINRKKFLSRILLLIVILIVIIFGINVITNHQEDSSNKAILILDNQDITSTLVYDVYIDKDKRLYLSMEDVKNIFDKTLYFEEETGKIITTSDTKTAAIDTNNNLIELNSAIISMSAGIIKYEKTIYIPISEMTNIYNIEIKTTEKSAIILSLYKRLITAKTEKEVSVKADTSIFSKTIQKLEKDEEIIFIENVEKSDWIKMLTFEGKIGYIKEKDIREKTEVRIDMTNGDFSSNEPDISNALEFTYMTLTDDNLRTFTLRKTMVQDTITEVISQGKYTVCINLEKVNMKEVYLERFIIELIPRLKEIGACLTVQNNSILSDEFIKETNL